MKRFRGEVLISVVCLLCATLATADDTKDWTRIAVGEAVTFKTPGGKSATIQAGEYNVKASAKRHLQLVPVGEGDPVNIAAEAISHDESSIDSPITVFFGTESEGQKQFHIVLLLPDGQALESVGVYGEILSRGLPISTSPTTIVSQAIQRQRQIAYLPPPTECSDRMGGLACKDVDFDGYQEYKWATVVAPDGYEITNWKVVVHEKQYSEVVRTAISSDRKMLNITVRTEGDYDEVVVKNAFGAVLATVPVFTHGIYRASYYVYGNPISSQ